MRVGEQLLDSLDNAGIGSGTGRLRAQCPLVGEPDKPVVPVGLAQPLKGALTDLGAFGPKLGYFCQLTFVQGMEIRVVRLANRTLRMTSRFNFNEVTFKPADALLLGVVED